ncbi:hypothetical protein, partial [Mesorhizobium sp. WSM4303]|uniref:hypothetical protein n=1 Tax=Mesorhizobium sp. WSM4303 TaxID=2589887 RepID=UPI001AEDCE3D
MSRGVAVAAAGSGAARTFCDELAADCCAGKPAISALPLIVLPDVRHSKSQAVGFSSASRTI